MNIENIIKCEKVYLLDLDGTLAKQDKNLIAKCQLNALKKLGHNITLEEVKKKGLNKIIEEYNINANQFWEIYETFDPYKAVQEGQMTLYNDAKQFLLDAKGKKAVVSNSSYEATIEKLKALGIEDKLDAVVAYYDKERAKPNSFMLEEALKKLNSGNKNKIYVIGNEPYDISAGNELKKLYDDVITVYVNRDNKKLDQKPDMEVKDFLELIRLEGLI